MHLFRKHRRALLIFIFLAVGVPMLFFGIPWGGAPGMPGQDVELARVAGVPVMASEFHRNLTSAGRRQSQGAGEVPSFAELQEQGVAGEIFEQMLTSALITSIEEKRNFHVGQDFLVDQLKQDPSFQDDAGNFNGARFNAWVKANPNMDWDAVYTSIEEQLSRQAYMSAQLASANRILDKDVKQELIDNTSKIQMEYIKVEPPVELSEEELQAYYDENKANYQDPPTYTANYVAFSLQPSGPGEEVAKVLERARGGEDFAALADEVSDLETKNGGDLGWVTERETELEYRKPLFALAAGEVSDPAKGPNGYYIYKVEEERTNEETEQREVKARHIFINVTLSDADRLEQEVAAEKLAELTREKKDLAAAATELGYTVQTASGFNVESTEIEGIPNVDSFQFRRSIDEEAGREAPEFNVITGRDNLYVAQKMDEQEGATPPLSDVRAEVTTDATAAKKGEESYREATTEYAEKIAAQAKTLDEVKTTFPELDVQIKETRPFTKKEYLFQDQIYLQTQDIYAALADKEENQLAGPLTDFLGGTYFIALTNRIEATEEEKENWEEEEKNIRDRMLATARFELTQDFTIHLQETQLPLVSVSMDEVAYNAMVSAGEDEIAEEPVTDLPTDIIEISSEDGATEEVPAEDGAAEEAAPAADEAS